MSWERAPSDYGLPKQNHKPVVNPEYDLDASEYERLAVDVAAMTLTAAKALVVVSAAASTSATTGTMLRWHNARWGGTDAVKPTIARTATGAYTITWSTSQEDLNPTADRVSTSAVSFSCAQCTPQGSTPAMVVVSCASNVVYVKTFNAASAATDVDFMLSVY